MNLAIPSPLRQPPSARDLLDRALDPFILLGMPNLTPAGLSETWLMKELGHRHWLLLARHLGMENADFRTADGRKIYASICASSLRNACLTVAEADDVLEMRSFIMPLSRCRFSSRHRLTIGNRLIGDIELVSVFVTRRAEQDNYSLIRVDQGKADIESFGTSELAEAAATSRRIGTPSYLGLPLDELALPLLAVAPDYIEDFNGAGLLYFAHFHAIFAKATRQVDPRHCLQAARRDIFFYGNIQPDEVLSVTLEHRMQDGNGLSCKMVRSDGKIIARCFSRLDG